MEQFNMNLKATFYSAFAARMRPADDNMLRPEALYHEEEGVRDLLTKVAREELAPADIRTELWGNLWMLTPEAYLYFLPAFMATSLASYALVGAFVSDLIATLTEPTRADVVRSLDILAEMPPGIGFTEEIMGLLRTQQLEWIDSGVPQAYFHECVDIMTPAEGAAVLDFLLALQETHGADFPFGEVETAIERHWSRYRGGRADVK
jgi:hypothetical protein